MCAEVAALLALSKSTSNQAKFMEPSSNWQQARQFWQHAVICCASNRYDEFESILRLKELIISRLRSESSNLPNTCLRAIQQVAVSWIVSLRFISECDSTSAVNLPVNNSIWSSFNSAVQFFCLFSRREQVNLKFNSNRFRFIQFCKSASARKSAIQTINVWEIRIQ